MVLAALGHDLYEDSPIPPADIVADYGPEVDRLIQWLTEKGGVPAYVEQMASAPEEARPIKLCDGIDNYGGLVENGLVRADLAKWAQVVRHHMEPMFSRLQAIPFRQYPEAGRWLNQELAVRRERFWAVVENLLPTTVETAIPKLTSRFEDALQYATKLHARQTRKGTTIPYVSHLLAVTAIVLEDGGSEDEAIAALLHDSVEDQGGDPTRQEIPRRFGEKVAAILEGCADADVVPKPPWLERKKTHLEHLRHATPEVIRISAADKLHNARAVLADFRQPFRSHPLGQDDAGEFAVAGRDIFLHLPLALSIEIVCRGEHLQHRPQKSGLDGKGVHQDNVQGAGEGDGRH